MGRPPSSTEENGLKKGPWTPEEDEKLSDYINRHGHGSWRTLPRLAGLNRCGKSCRLRWMNYLRPDIRRGNFSEDEESLIIHLHSIIGNKWSQIATHLPGRTDNEIKNLWNTHLKKKLIHKGIDPKTHKPIPKDHIPNDLLLSLIIAQSPGGPSNNNPGIPSASNRPWETIATELAKIHLVHDLIQFVSTNSPTMDRSASTTLLGHYSNSESQNIIPGAIPNITDLHQAMNSWAGSESGNSELPSMWPSSSNERTESTPTASGFSAKPNASMNVFEDLEKLMEDDTCASFLKDFLEE